MIGFVPGIPVLTLFVFAVPSPFARAPRHISGAESVRSPFTAVARDGRRGSSSASCRKQASLRGLRVRLPGSLMTSREDMNELIKNASFAPSLVAVSCVLDCF